MDSEAVKPGTSAWETACPGYKPSHNPNFLSVGIPPEANGRCNSQKRENVCAALAARLREDHFAAGRPIVVEGEVGDRLYVIAGGRAEATLSTADAMPA